LREALKPPAGNLLLPIATAGGNANIETILKIGVINMCLGLPGKVMEITGKRCIVDIMGATREISVDFMKDLKIGDYVLIHAGCAISKIDEEEAQITIDIFKEIKEVMHG